MTSCLIVRSAELQFVHFDQSNLEAAYLQVEPTAPSAGLHKRMLCATSSSCLHLNRNYIQQHRLLAAQTHALCYIFLLFAFK
jgi:hypothetical protein